MKSLQIFVLLTLSALYVVEGAECMKSFGRFSCSPCGKGSRCFWCSWCTGFCFNGQTRSTRETEGIEYGSVEALYKVPFLDLFNDLEALLRGDVISDLDVVALYKSISSVTREDCTICNENPELNALSIFAAKVNEELVHYIGTILFKPQAMDKTTKTKTMVQNLPESLKIKVDPASSILESVKGNFACFSVCFVSLSQVCLLLIYTDLLFFRPSYCCRKRFN